jgi:hypothetical protein
MDMPTKYEVILLTSEGQKGHHDATQAKSQPSAAALIQQLLRTG